MTAHLIAVGDNCLDVYLRQGNYAIGGNALNVAADWRAAGRPARYIGAVGTDPAAELLLAGVAQAGLGPEHVRRLPGATGVTFIDLADGDRKLLHEEFGVGLDLRLDERELAEVARADWVHLQGTAPEARLVERLVSAGARVSVDLSTYHVTTGIAGVAVAFASVSGSDAAEAEALAERLLAAGAALAVIMRGEHGSIAWDGVEMVRHAAQRIDPVDTCGAGDSFIAAFTGAIVSGAPVRAAMAEATGAASRTCLHFGGWEQTLNPSPQWLHDQAVAVGISPALVGGAE
ncbi:PfkB family carbohydrate kinase [Naasia sp. SYSU D00057]|uniref:PfkB family carbohydrate kinase n=1 Tax=Naasia sp. SYSU D00057 TaxID=2817380 RepID=UPI001B3101B6|nr:PfkB family carbohydrate kinase [Naasia sp. SYSU D00057]